MTEKKKSALLWIVAVLFTLIIVVYQKATGPTYPIKGKVELSGEIIKYKLSRSHMGGDDAMISVDVNDTKVKGILKYKRYRSEDEWVLSEMIFDKDKLHGILPGQPPAGKLAYIVELYKDEEDRRSDSRKG